MNRSVLFPSPSPSLVATITFKKEGRRNPLLEIRVLGDTYAELEGDALKQITTNLDTAKYESVEHDEVHHEVRVCGSLPEGREYCLPARFTGTIREIVEAASAQLRQIFHELYTENVSEDAFVDPQSLLERSLVESIRHEARIRRRHANRS